MAKTRYIRLAEEIGKFYRTVDNDLYGEKGLSKTCRIESATELHEEFLCNIWLRCETAQEQQERKILRASTYCLEQDTHRGFYDQYQHPDSRLWQNLGSRAQPVYTKWLTQCLLLTEQGSRQVSYDYPFEPMRGERVEQSLLRVTDYIKNAPSRHYKAIALLYHQALVTFIFAGTGIRLPVTSKAEVVPAYGLYILRQLGCSLEEIKEWQDQRFLTVPPGRRPISRQRARRYMIALIEWYLSDPKKFKAVGETVLVGWILLACSQHQRRFCGVTDILKLSASQLTRQIHERWKCNVLAATFGLQIKNELVPISASLSAMLSCLSDQRKINQPIIQIDRSTVENHLHVVSERLGFDPDIDPVTPETFLEPPHFFGEDIRGRASDRPK